MEIVGLIFFFLFLIAGVIVIPFGIAGTFVIVVDALIFGLITGFEKITISFIGILLALAVIVELLEAFLGAYMAKRFGGSKWAMGGAIAGGLIGAVAGTPMLPVIGTFLGCFLGAFIGAALLELVHSSDLENALKAGFGAFFGTVGGKMTKILVAIIMVVLICGRLS